VSAETVGSVILWLIVLAAIIVIAVYLLRWLYRRSTKETAFVRTGLGGEKVVISGGAFVVPVLHEITPVGMNAMRIEIALRQTQGLITQNRMRVDVVADFYVRVGATQDEVSRAAQTLGRRTLETDGVRELLEGRFAAALRSAAAQMTLEELHERRQDYAEAVKAAALTGLAQNGLELESVAIVDLDQPPLEFFDASNAFDAEGLTQLTEQIERRKKVRNDIEQDTMIQIRNKNLEAEKQSLAIDQASEAARLEHEQELEVRRAAQRAEVARERAQQEQQAEQAQLAARLEVERSRIATDLALQEERIRQEREVQRLEVDRRKALELAEQQRAIAVAEASKSQSEAQAEAELARAKAVAAEEKVFSARETEVAQRRKEIELIQAAQDAERDALRIKVAAEAEKDAALDRAEAQRMNAEAEAEADKIRALAARLRYEIEAEGTRLMNEAQNTLTPESRASAMRLRLIDRLEAIIRESVKPMEKIEGIKILHVDGLGGGAPAGGGAAGSFADSIVNSALRYRAQAPLVDTLLKEIGLSGTDLGKLGSMIREPVSAEDELK